MVVPNSQESKHASRELAMDSEMRTQNAVPVFYDTTGTHRTIPSQQEALNPRLPVGWEALDQFGSARTQQTPALPSPANEGSLYPNGNGIR